MDTRSTISPQSNKREEEIEQQQEKGPQLFENTDIQHLSQY